MTEKITPLELKRINKNRIFRLIYDRKALKRQDLADELSLSLPTVNQNIKELMEEGMIEFSGEFNSTGGRKPQVITPVRMSRLTVALNIRKTYVRVVLVDLYGDVMASEREELEFADTDEYSKKLGKIVDSFITKQNCRNEITDSARILGVGITIPGIFDRESERILIAPTLGIKDYDIKRLTKYMKHPTIVVNDARASAFTYIRKSDEIRHGVYLLVDRGVGGCIIEDGKLVRGTNNRAGEIGHMTIVPGGRKCACGKSGCLENYISITNLSDTLNAELTDEYLIYLALGISNLYTIFDGPIIIGGGLASYLEPNLSRLHDKLKEMNPILLEELDIRIDANSKKEALTGAALMLIEEFVKGI